jgi:hypothetical protein
MIRNLISAFRTTCRHPSGCTTTPGPDDLMCTAHAADESLASNPDDRLKPWDLDRRNRWPNIRGWRRNG